MSAILSFNPQIAEDLKYGERKKIPDKIKTDNNNVNK